MTAEEIRAEGVKNVVVVSHKQLTRIQQIALMQYGALMEIAAQLAELNEKPKLDPNSDPDPFWPKPV